MTGPAPASAFRRVGAAAFAVLALTGAARAGDVTVRIDGLRGMSGQVLVALCKPQFFAKRGCAITGRAPAGQSVTLPDVPPGTYAAQAIHDENGDGDLNRALFLPTEGIGFSRDAPMRRGPPDFADAAVSVSPAGGTLTLTMRYFR